MIVSSDPRTGPSAQWLFRFLREDRLVQIVPAALARVRIRAAMGMLTSRSGIEKYRKSASANAGMKHTEKRQ